MLNIQKLNQDSPLYPKALLDLKDPPQCLYYAGNLELLKFTEALAIVGTRDITPYGESVVKKFVTPLKNSNVVVISGFMRGADMAVHETCLLNNVKTVGVLPCGLAYDSPTFPEEVKEEVVAKNGLLLSEYADTEEPRKWTFVKRNRVVAALCKCLLVVEAGLGSGSLITADLAHALGRRVFAVPASIFSARSEGALHLLKRYAQPATEAKDLGFTVSWTPGSLRDETSQQPKNETLEFKVLDVIKHGEVGIEQLITYFDDIPFKNVVIAISNLMARGLIQEKDGLYYAKNS